MPDHIFLPAIIAALSLITAVGHSWLGEARIFGPLYAENNKGILARKATRDVIRVVWHLSSIAWVTFGIALLTAVGPQVSLHMAAAAMFAVSGFGNLLSMRRAHIGGLMLLSAAALTFLNLYYLTR